MPLPYNYLYPLLDIVHRRQWEEPIIFPIVFLDLSQWNQN